MKKIILLFLLLFSFIAMAQGPFVRKYTRMYSSTSNEFVNCNVTVVFNSENSDADIVVYVGDRTHKFYRRENDVIKDKDKENNTYQLVVCLDSKGNTVGIQIYDEDSTFRILSSDSGYLEFYN